MGQHEQPGVRDPSFSDQAWYRNFRHDSVRWAAAHTDEVEIRVRENFHPVVSMLMPIGTFEPSLARNVLKANVSASYFLEPLNRIHHRN